MCCRRLCKLGSFGPERRGGSFGADFAPAASVPQAQCARIYRRTTNGERSMSEAHAHVDPANKKVALFIAVVAALLWIAYALGAVGVVFSLIGFFWPTAVHLF